MSCKIDKTPNGIQSDVIYIVYLRAFHLQVYLNQLCCGKVHLFQ